MMLSKDTSESQPLLGLPTAASHPLVHQSARFPNRFQCFPSKGAFLIFLWTLFVGMVYKTITAGSTVAVDTYLSMFHGQNVSELIFEVETIFWIHLMPIIATVFYPVSGFIADIYVGRYKVVIFSVFLILCGCVSFSVGSALYLSNIIEAYQATVTRGLKEFAAVLIVGYLLTLVGISGYQSNYIQLGLDQLQDAPSYSLGLFVHSVEWFMILGMMLFQLVLSWCTCIYDQTIMNITISMPFLFVLMLLLLLIFGWWKHHWFRAEPVRHNPYRTVFRVIYYSARKHKYTVNYGAYDDDEQPSRLDYAKIEFGGPFTNEQVEDVKAFLNILMVLLCLGPVFVLVVPVGLIYAKFVQHVTRPDKTAKSCSWKWVILDTGGLKYITASLIFPVYIWLLYSVLRNRIPRIFTRLWIWIFTFVICIGSMVLVDLSGHLLYYHQDGKGMACMLTQTLSGNNTSTLKLSWAVVILPSLLQVVAPMMVITTTFEFITAQSPYAMKGLLVGMFFAIMGIFEFLGSVMLLPFYLPQYWSKEVPVINCGFGYLLSTCAVGTTGLVLFSIAAKSYKYRERK